MEITRQTVISLSPLPERTVSANNARVAVGHASTVSPQPGLERIQSALRQLPQVDLDKVATLKAALAAGEISTDSASLAGAMLSYHRGER